jgi:hypothetical protein
MITISFQGYIPNDGYYMRVIVVGNRFFGFYRKVLLVDFRASRMKLEEFWELLECAIKIALKLNGVPGVYMFEADGSYHFDRETLGSRISTMGK